MKLAKSRHWTLISARSFVGAALALGLFARPVPAVVVKGTVTFRGAPLASALQPADAVVILHGAKKPPHAEGPATIDQRQHRFVPRVIVVVPGTRVQFPNHDASYHNVYSRSRSHRFDLGLYPPGETRSTIVENPGVIEIRCSAHPDMEAYVVVSDSPYHARVSESGIYQIGDVDAGTYEVELWHPDATPVRKPLTVEPQISVLTVDLDLRERDWTP